MSNELVVGRYTFYPATAKSQPTLYTDTDMGDMRFDANQREEALIARIQELEKEKENLIGQIYNYEHIYNEIVMQVQKLQEQMEMLRENS